MPIQFVLGQEKLILKRTQFPDLPAIGGWKLSPKKTFTVLSKKNYPNLKTIFRKIRLKILKMDLLGVKLETLEKKLISYYPDCDILFVHKGYDSDEKFKGNFDVGDIVLDVSNKGKVRGIEVMKASEYLQLNTEVLNHLTDFEFQVDQYKNRIGITLVLIADQIKKEKDIIAPLAMALS